MESLLADRSPRTDLRAPTAVVRVLIVDDHPIVRRGLRAVLDGEAGVLVVGEAGNGAEALDALATARPDVILMDLRMPEVGGVQATGLIKARSPATQVVILSSFEDDEGLFGAILAGAIGYMLKDSPPDDLLRAIQAAAQGFMFIHPVVAPRVLAEFQRLQDRERVVLDRLRDGLTDREREVLTLIARGRSNRQISDQLFISEKTVKSHISAIFSKLQVTDRSQAVVHALKGGLVE